MRYTETHPIISEHGKRMADGGYGGEQRIGREFEPVSEQVWQAVIGGYEQAYAAWAQYVQPVLEQLTTVERDTDQYLQTLDLRPPRSGDTAVGLRSYHPAYDKYQERLGALHFEFMLRRAEHGRLISTSREQVDSLLGGKVLFAKGTPQHTGFILADGENRVVGTAYGRVFGLYDGVDLSRGAVRLKLPEGGRGDYAHVQLFLTDGSRFRLCELFARS